MVDRTDQGGRFPATKLSWTPFDFLAAVGEATAAWSCELARCECLDRTGERHGASTTTSSATDTCGPRLGLAACQRGLSVEPTRFTTAASLVHELIEALGRAGLLNLGSVARVKPVIVTRWHRTHYSDRQRSSAGRSVQQRYEAGTRSLVGPICPSMSWTDVTRSSEQNDRRPGGSPPQLTELHPGNERRGATASSRAEAMAVTTRSPAVPLRQGPQPRFATKGSRR